MKVPKQAKDLFKVGDIVKIDMNFTHHYPDIMRGKELSISKIEKPASVSIPRLYVVWMEGPQQHSYYISMDHAFLVAPKGQSQSSNDPLNIEKFLKIAISANKPALIIGLHGIGKSYSVYKLAKENKRKLYRIVLTGEVTPEDLIGMYELDEGSTKFAHRPLLQAVEEGAWILFDELNVATPPVLTLLNGLLETDPDSRFLNVGEKQIKPHKNFRLFATGNPSSYAGTQAMNEALLSRFLCFHVEPDYKQFIDIIRGKTADKQIVSDAEKFVSACVKVFEKIEYYISPRELLTFADLRISGLPFNEAVQIVLSRFYDLENDEKDTLFEYFNVEHKRAKIHILNDTELQQAIEKETMPLKDQIYTLQRAKGGNEITTEFAGELSHLVEGWGKQAALQNKVGRNASWKTAFQTVGINILKARAKYKEADDHTNTVTGEVFRQLKNTQADFTTVLNKVNSALGRVEPDDDDADSVPF